MLEFDVWRDLAIAYVRVTARALGWSVSVIKRSKTTRSVYLELECPELGTRQVRLSDHDRRGTNWPGSTVFSVKQRYTGRFRELAAWLQLQRG